MSKTNDETNDNKSYKAVADDSTAASEVTNLDNPITFALEERRVSALERIAEALQIKNELLVKGNQKVEVPQTVRIKSNNDKPKEVVKTKRPYNKKKDAFEGENTREIPAKVSK